MKLIRRFWFLMALAVPLLYLAYLYLSSLFKHADDW